MKRFDNTDRGAAAGTRSGPRARAAQDRQFGDARGDRRDFTKADPYQRAERPPRASMPRDAAYGGRLRPPVRGGAIALDPDVARVFRDSEAVNEALRMVIRLARTVGGARPAFSRNGAAASPRSGPPTRSAPRGSAERFGRDQRPRERPSTPRPTERDPRFEETE